MKDGTRYNQKDIVLIPFPYSDLSGSKQRPALVISNEKINKTQDRICCLITTSPHKDDLKIEADSFEEGTLPFQSYVKSHRIFTVVDGVIKKKLCTVNDKFFDNVILKINSYIKRV